MCVFGFFSRLHRNKKSYSPASQRIASQFVSHSKENFVLPCCYVPSDSVDTFWFDAVRFFLLQHLLCVIIWVVLLNIYARYCCGCLFSAFHISYQCKECTWKSSINQIAHRKMCTHTHQRYTSLKLKRNTRLTLTCLSDLIKRSQYLRRMSALHVVQCNIWRHRQKRSSAWLNRRISKRTISLFPCAVYTRRATAMFSSIIVMIK